MKQPIQQVRITNGKIGELLVELELTARGWHVERLDGSSKATNGDLIAIKNRARFVIQVKTNGTQKNRAYLGHATKYLKTGANFFNSKNAVMETDIVVCVSGDWRAPIFHVFTAEEANTLAQKHARDWAKVPTKQGKERSINFPVSPKHEELTLYQNAWGKLDL